MHAAEWVAEPTVTIASTYNDNVRLRSVNEVDSTSASLSAGLNAQIKQQVWGLNIDTRVRTVQYSDEAGLDTNNVFVNLGSHYRTELQRWNFAADFERNTTFDENFSTQFFANGILDAQTQREKIVLSPAWSWTMNPLWSMRVSLQATDIKYDEVNSLILSDSATDSAQVSTKYQLDDVADVNVTVAYSKTERDQDKREIGFYEYENTSYQLSYNYQSAENSTLNIGFGRRETNTIGAGVPACNLPSLSLPNCSFPFAVVLIDTNTTNTGNTFSVSYNYNGEISDYSIALNRSITTSTSGFAQEVDDITIRYNRKLSATLALGLILHTTEATSIDSLSASIDRDSLRIEPSLAWRFSKDSRLSVGYRYRQQTFAQSGVESEANSIYINLSFFWPRLMSSY